MKIFILCLFKSFYVQFAQLDTPTEDPEELGKPQGPCSSQCEKVSAELESQSVQFCMSY